MKTLYTFIFSILISANCWSQNYELGLVHNSDYNFKIVAIPDFDSSGDTDISDIGFALMLPAGMDDIANQTSLLSGRVWNVTEFDAAFLTGQGLGDGTRDAFQFNMPAGQSLVAHTMGQMIDLVSFDVSNMPTSGEMSFLLNSDPIAMGAGGVLDSFYNSNIDNTTTQDYFSGIAPGLENFMFDTLSIQEIDDFNDSIKVFPNPTSNLVFVRANAMVELIECFDLSGKLIMSISNSGEINMNQLPSGLYILKIQIQEKGLTKRIIKN
ncbi:MAG: T9SS type A sorting domain-containing protein [Flavobacteriaceae bacterium]|nr:T9SS type A sorting domain-containing protein [Flavobacteriaceae bacterium]